MGVLGAVLLLTVALTTGCEESVNPVLGTERAFTLYGFFNPRADTQAVRIFAIEGRLELTRPEPLDAEVASMDLQMSQQQAWQDSVVQYESGRYGHVYWSEFRAEFEHRYRLEAVRSDGATAQVEVTVPPLSEPLLLPPIIAPRFVFIPCCGRMLPVSTILGYATTPIVGFMISIMGSSKNRSKAASSSRYASATTRA
ncbi:MAG: DUF4249 family protein [Bacteroidetes bacterium]|nr:DUF4249 family protein [Bacteroidota bacterium]